MLILQGWAWREMKYSKGLSNLLQNKTTGCGREAGERRGGGLHLVGNARQGVPGGSERDTGWMVSTSVVRWGGLALEGSANAVWDMPSPRCCWNIQMDMQIRQFDQWAQSQRRDGKWNIHREAVSMEKPARHWETATVPEHQPSEDGAGWHHNVTTQI